MDNKTFLYARVSSTDQNVDRQIIALKEYCKSNSITVSSRDIFEDKVSGKNMDRPQYQAMKLCCRRGDTVIIKELDRLARNKELIKEELRWFKDNGIRVKILNLPTTLMDLEAETSWVLDMVNNILIEVLGAIAEEERIKIKKRQEEGIAAAKAKGKHLGRPKATYPTLWEMYYVQWKSGSITAKECMEQLELKRTTFYKLAKKYEEDINENRNEKTFN